MCAVAVHLAMPAFVAAAVSSAPARETGPLSPNPYADGSFRDLVAFRIDNLVLFRLGVVFILPGHASSSRAAVPSDAV